MFTLPVLKYALKRSDAQPCVEAKQYIERNGPFFGVFVGVTRSVKHKQWPYDVHGSIGYWDEEFKKVSADELCHHMYRVARAAAQTDSRRDYFPSLSTDPQAVLDIKFMRLPLREIDSGSGRYKDTREFFHNIDDGLLLQGEYGRATYLPGVFPNAKWGKIHERLISKAGSTGKFYGYTTDRLEIKVGSGLNGGAFAFGGGNSLACKFMEFVNKAVVNVDFDSAVFVPFIATPSSLNSLHLRVDETENVRNIGTLGDLIDIKRELCQNFTFSSVAADRLGKDLKHYVEKYKQIPKAMRQASCFLLGIVGSRMPKLAYQIMHQLFTSLDVMEPRFELGEALMYLQLQSNRLNGQQQKVLDSWVEKLRAPDGIFELNWQAQFLHARRKTNQQFTETEKKKFQQLRELLTQFVATFEENDTETNFYAVAYEAAAALQLRELSKTLLTFLIENRCNKTHGLFLFRDGVARIDISGHVYRGIMIDQSQPTLL